MTKSNIQTCSRCLYDETFPNITFDEEGVCSYCRIFEKMEAENPLGEEGKRYLEEMVAKIKKAGKGKKYDCIIGVSGGCDSSYLVYRLHQMGVRMLAVHFDNTWSTPISTQNIYKVLDKLGVELYTHVMNNKEFDDIVRSFMLAGVKDIDIATDIGFASTLYRQAAKHNIKYIVEGHSFRTEGVTPQNWAYIDGKYIASVHNQFGTMKRKTFPNMTMTKFLYWIGIKGIERLRPLYHMEYDKEKTKEFLTKEFGWEWYGEHHGENRWTRFLMTYFFHRRFDIDYRIVGHAAQVRSGQIPRTEGEKRMAEPYSYDEELVDLVKKRLNISDDEFEKIMSAPRKDYTDFKTYKSFFVRFRFLFFILYKMGRVPKTFYMRYTKKGNV